MKKALLCIALLFFCFVALAPEPAHAPTTSPAVVEQQPPQNQRKRVKQVQALVERVNPAVPAARVRAIARAVVEEAHEFSIPHMVLAGILAQESTFKPGLHVCYPRPGAPQGFSCDIGLGQVNWETWGDELALDRMRLLLDDRYNIRTAAAILLELKRSYGHENNWWSRYHNANAKHRETYEQRVAMILQHRSGGMSSNLPPYGTRLRL